MSEDQVTRIGPQLSVVEPASIAPDAEETIVAELRRLLGIAERGDLAGFSYVAQRADGTPMTALAGEFLDPFVGIGALELLKLEVCKTVFVEHNHPGGDNGAA